VVVNTAADTEKDKIGARIEAVTPETFRNVARRLFGADAYTLTTIGPVPEPAAVA